MIKNKICSAALEETEAIGETLGKILPPNSILALYGELGAGKTTLVRGLVRGAAKLSGREVCSPTFTYLNIYSGQTDIYHFDLYRLRSEEEFSWMGFDEYFYRGGICCIEWSEKIPSLLPKNTLAIHLTHEGEGMRYVQICEIH